MPINVLRICSGFGLPVFAVIPMLAIGQNGAPTAPSPSDTLEPVVVTAERRKEDLEKTPVSVAAIGQESIEKKAIVSEQDLQSAVPGFTVRSTTSSNQFTYSLRGQSVDSFSSSQPAVLSYLDEVQTSPLSATPFYDLSSIQVLKGPQGTLFGRNATGGAVLFTTAWPTDVLGGYAKVRLGDYNYQNIEGALNMPLAADRLVLRVAGDYQHRDGFYYNEYTNSTVGELLREGARVSLLAKFTDEVTNTIVVDYAFSGGTNAPEPIYSVYAPGSTNRGIPLDSLSSVLFSPALNAAIGVPGAWTAYLAAHPGAYPGGLDAYATVQKSRSPFIVDVNSGLDHRADTTTVSNITTAEISPVTTLKNIFGYNKSFANDQYDVDGTPYTIQGTAPAGITNGSRTYSDELQLLGNTLDSQLNYVGGLYFSHQTSLYNAPFVVYDLSPIIPVTPVHEDVQSRSEVYAGYAQGTFDFSKSTGITGLSATAGVRFTNDRIKLTELPGSTYYNVPGTFNNESDSVNLPSYEFGVQEQLNSDLLVYVVNRHSFRSGGFNVSAPPIPATAAESGNLFFPEKTTDVEIGGKYQGLLFGIPTRLNVDFYDQWILDIQRTTYAAPPGFSLASLTVNVPKADVRGAEMDVQISPTTWLDIGGNVAYTDARFTENQVNLFGQTTTYGPYADTAKWSGSIFAQATLATALGPLSFRSDAYEQSKVYFSSLAGTITPDTEISGYAVVNFRVAADHVNGSNATVAVYVRNAFNRLYYTGGFAPGNVLSVNVAQPGDPRTFFVELGYNF